MTDENLKAIREEWESTTPGEWVTGPQPFAEFTGAHEVIIPHPAAGYRVIAITNIPFPANGADARFIAAAHQTVPALLAEAVRLKEENAQLQEQVNIAATFVSQSREFRNVLTECQTVGWSVIVQRMFYRWQRALDCLIAIPPTEEASDD